MLEGADDKKHNSVNNLGKKLKLLKLDDISHEDVDIDEDEQQRPKSLPRGYGKNRSVSTPEPVKSARSSWHKFPFTPRGHKKHSSPRLEPRKKYSSPRLDKKKKQHKTKLPAQFEFKNAYEFKLEEDEYTNALEYAVSIKRHTTELFQTLTLHDFFDERYKGAKIKIDAAYNELSEEVKIAIIKADQAHMQIRLNFYAQVLRTLLDLNNFNDAHAVFCALSSPEVTRLCKIDYSLSLGGEVRLSSTKKGFLEYPPSALNRFLDALYLFTISNGQYAKMIKEYSRAGVIPWMIPIYMKVNRIDQMSDKTLKQTQLKTQAKHQLFDEVKKFKHPLPAIFDPESDEIPVMVSSDEDIEEALNNDSEDNHDSSEEEEDTTSDIVLDEYQAMLWMAKHKKNDNGPKDDHSRNNTKSRQKAKNKL